MPCRIILPSQTDMWNSYVQNLSFNDVFYCAEYYALNAKTAGCSAEMFVYEEGNDFVLYPYLKMPINTLPFFELAKNELTEAYYDVSTLEYGGPATNAPQNTALLKNFAAQFSEHCQQANIVTEFARLHPFLKNHQYINGAKKIKNVFFIDLEQDIERINANMNKRCRNAVSKAKRLGVNVIQSRSKEDINKFYELYAKTMDLHQAKKFYYYSREYFDKLFDVMGDQVKLFLAKHNERIIAGSLFLAKDKIVHYYLSAMDSDSSVLCPTNLILSEAIAWSKAQGYVTFNLGGGYGENDGLSKFKRSFTNTSAEFYRVSRIHNLFIYSKLREFCKKYVQLKGIKNADLNYVPIYRG